MVDDAIGLGIIAVFYPDPDNPVTPVWLLLTAGGMAVAVAMRRMEVKYWLLYVAIAGAMSWVGLIKAAIEPAFGISSRHSVLARSQALCWNFRRDAPFPQRC